jgi:hypothetical protein
LWVGESLGAVERACLRSVLRQGHGLALYCYGEPPRGVPEGTELRDAGEIIPEQTIPQQWRVRADLYSDWFRYELQRRGAGTWLDTDVYLIAPIDHDSPYLFGEQQTGMLNNAVLRLPPTSPILPRLLEPFERRTTPRWLPRRLYWASRVREWLTGSADLTRLPWGTTSPHALTAIARDTGLYHLAQPMERFYPVPWQQADWILDPALSLDEMIAPGTVAVHLWNEVIKSFKNRPAPAGSFLERLQREGSD